MNISNWLLSSTTVFDELVVPCGSKEAIPTFLLRPLLVPPLDYCWRAVSPVDRAVED
jgi:hypothetical protein